MAESGRMKDIFECFDILYRIEEARWEHLEKVHSNHVGDIRTDLEILQMCGVIRAQLRERQVRNDTQALRESR